MRSVLIAVAALAMTLAPMVDAVAAKKPNPTAAGRMHAKKAGQLAAAGKCKAAVPLFTRAYGLLKDPAILFNRAECLRKLGLNQKALADYEKFLADLPNAPNRSSVEQRIAALRPPRKVPAAEKAKPAPPVVVEAKPEPKAAHEPQPVAEVPQPVEVPKPVEPPPAPVAVIAMAEPPKAPAPPATDHAQLAPTPAATDAGVEEAGGTRWALWITLGAVVVAGGVTGFLLARHDATGKPMTALGHYKF